MSDLTRRTALAVIGGTTLFTPFIGRAQAAGSLNVYNWANYIGETTLEDFQSATGITVNYDNFASLEELSAKMYVGSTGYDVVFQAGMDSPPLIRAGVYSELDRSRLPGWKNLDPTILDLVAGWDEGNRHGVPYMWGSVGMTFNVDMVKERLPDADMESLDILFAPGNAEKLADCGISLLDSPTDIGFMVLKWLGIDPDTAGAPEYAKMAEAFAKIRPYVTTFDNGNFLNTMPSGEVCAVNSWSGDYSTVKMRAEEAGIELNLAYYVPRSGAPAWFDTWTMPVDAPNVENAYLFLDYLLRPDVIAACTDYTGYANANKAANELVDPEIAADPAVYPDEETLSRLYTPKPQTDEQDREINRAWQTIKTGG